MAMRFIENTCLYQKQKKKLMHLALQLPEIVSHILSYLTVGNQQDEQNRVKIYQHIYPCLFVNALWHDCTIRLMWRHITFEDSKSEYEAFLNFAQAISNYPQAIQTMDINSPAVLAIAVPKASSGLFFSQDKRLTFLKQQKRDTEPSKLIAFDTNGDTVRTTRSAAMQQSNMQSSLWTHQQYQNAVRSISLKKIKDKTINEPLQHIGHYTKRLEKLDIYICDHLSDSSIYTFIIHNHQSLTYLSLAGCNRITDEAVLSVAKHCPRLEHLDLRACGLISDVSIQEIANQCPRLHHLNVGRVRDREKITSRSIKLIALKTQVAVLGLAGCDMTDECLVLLAKCRGAGLERISVNNCYRITNKSVQAYVKHCPNLSVFEMKECHWIDDWGSVAELVQRKVLLTLCDQQNRACAEWARQRGRIMEVKAR
ncbi:uncharacterized protein B0P05DRAFT_549091 [Gilbertella persicaria]|uniref:uncharacterized protein n=1 Tax=Gilbertella persicaria TaxID=101096 RepID=UPI00221F245B|nr:uncharacterized protein B0P05DRAFT_549091 [Gilbertella persicaria]KAI8072148.1 hypothetical protein B0P05DRAFT_549091 [Gilbertella persicaria]